MDWGKLLMAVDKAIDSASLDAALATIADAIRTKNMENAKYKLEEMAGAIQEITTDTEANKVAVPSYVKEGAIELIDNVRKHQNSNTISLLCISDPHNVEDAEESSYANVIPSANKHCGQAAYLVAQLCNIDMCCMLGDYLLGGKAATYAYAEQDFKAQNGYLQRVFSIAPNARIWGNHDTLANSYAANGNTMWSESDMHNHVGKYNIGWTFGSELHNYGYYDFDDKGIRIIMLNSNEVDYITSRPIADAATQYISAQQLTWLGDVLNNMPESYKAVILSHHPIDWAPGTTRPAADILETYADKVLCCLHGHVHNYRVANLKNTSLEDTTIKEIAIPNACYHRNNEYTTLNGIAWGTETTWSKTANSKKDTAFCVVTIDKANQVIYADHYGAGEDRIISVARYSISVNVSGCAVDGLPPAVSSGTAVSGTIVLPDNYAIDSCVITMGGTDITDTALYGNTISIESVTGDVTITVTASFVPSYTNLLDIQLNDADMPLCANKLINGYRTNSSPSTAGTAYSSGTYTATSYGRATVLLPCKSGDVIRIKGAYPGASTNDSISCFDAEKKSVAYTNGTNLHKNATLFEFTYDDASKTCQFVIPSKFPSGKSTDNTAYIVIGFTNSRTVADDEKVIITANEEII